MKQDKALEIMLRGDNVMLTGPAGSGKSWLLSEFIVKAKQQRKKVTVTATTGLAAAHLGGQTIHSWSGMGLGSELHEDYIYMMSEARKKIIRKADVLIIDEVSMMHDYNLDMVDQALRMIRQSDEVMGGIQLILCGDFFQLPPVGQGKTRFVTDSEAWKRLSLSVCYLEEQHRADDMRLESILNAMRAGDMRKKHLDWLMARLGEKPTHEVTRLYTLNKDVDDINSAELAKVPGDSHYYLRTSRGKFEAILNLQRNVLAPETLELKLNAMVMAVKNDPEHRFHNGSIGTVIDFTDEGFPAVQFDGGPVIVYPDEWELKSGDRTVAAITQIPLRLAYAITVHKSQGMTLDAAEIDISKAFVEGMGYVGLSRVKNLDNLYLKGINQRALMVSKEAQRIDKELRIKSRSLL